jgi:hypothetical protein
LLLPIRPVFIVGNVEEQVRVAFARASFQGAVAGQLSFIQLTNPAGSAVLCRVVWCESDLTPGGAADGFQLRVGVPPQAGTTGFPLDSRQGWAAGASQALVFAGSVAAAGGTFIATEAVPLGGTTHELGQFARGIIVAPGAALYMLRTTVNLGMNGAWVWTEEPL